MPCPLCVGLPAQYGPAAILAASSLALLTRRCAARVLHWFKQSAKDFNGGKVINMNLSVVSQGEWIKARRNLLDKEKDLTAQKDALSKELQNLPMMRVDKDYKFQGPSGEVSLLDLFQGKNQLIVYHFMFDPGWEEGCKSCSLLADGIAGAVLHLGARNTAFAAISRAPTEKLEAFKKRMGWTFLWYSSGETAFNYDFHVTIDAERGSTEYNYASASELLKRGKLWIEKGDLPGLSVFYREGDRIFHSYSSYQRGMDTFLNTYNLLDVTPLGRQDHLDPYIMAWVKHHDKYEQASA